MKTTHISILTLLTLTSVSAYEAGVALSASENAGGSERLRRPGTRNQRSLKKLKHVLPEVPGTQVEESSEGFSKLEDEPDVEEAETIEDEVPMTTRVLNLTAFTDLRGGQDHLDSKSVESNVKKASAGYQMMGKGSNGMGQNGKMTEGQGAAKGKKHSHSGKGKGAHAGKGKGAAKGKSKSKKASTSGKKKGKATGKTKKNGKKEMETISPSTFFPTTDFPVDSEAPSSAPLETSSPVANMVGSQFHITLDLEDVESGLRGAFQKAALRWQEIVIGDLEEYELDDETRQESYCSRLPQDSIDDLFVCASTETIDGVGGILGQAGPEYARFDEFIVPAIGYISLDAADVPALIRQGTVESVILHEMGHVLGIGTLFEMNEVQSWHDEMCVYEAETKASEEFRALSGCNTSVPLEQLGESGTACSHWAEDCLLGELMTGVASEGLEISRITVGALEDIGYDVDYSAADPFPVEKLSSSCVCKVSPRLIRGGIKLPDTLSKTTFAGSGETVEAKELEATVNEKSSDVEPEKTLPTPARGRLPIAGKSGSAPVVTVVEKADNSQGARQRRKLSDEGLKIAVDYGKGLLHEAKEKASRITAKEGSIYVADRVVSVFYLEAGEIYTVEVGSDDA